MNASTESGPWFYRLVRGGFRLLAVPLFRLRIREAQHVPARGAAIVVAPHRSWLDPAIVGAATPRPVHFLIMRKVYEKPWARWFYRSMRVLPVEAGGSRSLTSLREALRRLEAGGVIGIFPEGRVVRVGKPTRVYPGAAMLAAASGAPLIPLEIRGSARAWPYGRPLPVPHPVSARFHPAIDAPRAGNREDQQRVTQMLEVVMRELGDPPNPGGSK